MGNLIKDFFKPSKRDPRSQQDLNDEVNYVEIETLNDIMVFDNETETSYVIGIDIPHNFITTHMQDRAGGW